MDLATITGAVSAIQTAGEVAKSMLGIRDAAMIQGKVIELQGAILAAQTSALAAQSDQFTLLNRVRELEQQIADVKAWEAEKQSYELVELRPGAFAYAKKESMRGTSPAHKICANCFNQGSVSLLQEEVRYPGRVNVWFCQACGGDIFSQGRPEAHLPKSTKRR